MPRRPSSGRRDAGSSWARPVHVVELEQGVPEVLDGFRVRLAFQARCRVERHVVVEELAEERHPRRERGVVRVVDVQRGVGDQIPRQVRVGGDVHLVGRIHDAALLAQFLERIFHRLRIGGERR
jgi:hypothetical protein